MKPHPWQLAAAFAARAHRDQFRADGVTPYFSHCARVAAIVAVEFGCRDERAIAAAFLHDTIEDTPTDFDEIEREFGSAVATCVAALTKNHALPDAQRERDYDKRLAGADWQARLVKLADVYDNYLDAVTPAKQRKAAGRVRRAIALARVDLSEHKETARAIEVVSRLIR